MDDAIVAVANGYLIPLEKVPDDVFSKKTLGDGLAIQMTDTVVVSPADGIISFIYPHAFGVKLRNGIEILVHIGINTVSLNGAGFRQLVHKGDNVKKGDKIIKVDKDFIESRGFSCITMMVITETSGYTLKFHTEGDAFRGVSMVVTYC